MISETTIGLKLIKWMISKIKDSGCKKMADIFDSKVTFKLKCDTDKVEVYNKLTINGKQIKQFFIVFQGVSTSAAFFFQCTARPSDNLLSTVNNRTVCYKKLLGKKRRKKNLRAKQLDSNLGSPLGSPVC